MADAKVRQALALLQQAGHLDLVRPEAFGPVRTGRRASAVVVAAVVACLPPRAEGPKPRGNSGSAAGPKGPHFPKVAHHVSVEWQRGSNGSGAWGGYSGEEEPAGGWTPKVPTCVYGAQSGRVGEWLAGIVEAVEDGDGEGGSSDGIMVEVSSNSGTPDLCWQEPLDFEEEEPSEQGAARPPWQEEKPGPGAAGWITSAGRRTGWREAADAPAGWCGGKGFAPTGGSSVRAHQVYTGLRGLFLLDVRDVVVMDGMVNKRWLSGDWGGRMRAALRKGNL
ncbi:hypothetical protein NDU88_005103 [Pleurodeles waltl]|uniref:Uncharacterized protein n=1 Tax=Pleurodeles waltl TaxID=8319 RepID=A0AAV7MX27_PLEWA|nr:hypothetical protein NDU88_005103 [Pleurodeles waltl]